MDKILEESLKKEYERQNNNIELIHQKTLFQKIY